MMAGSEFYGRAFEGLCIVTKVVGIYAYAATQRLSADVLLCTSLDGVLGRLVFAVASAADSE